MYRGLLKYTKKKIKACCIPLSLALVPAVCPQMATHFSIKSEEKGLGKQLSPTF